MDLMGNKILNKSEAFNFFIPLDLAKSETGPDGKEDDKRWISGIASTPDLDLQGEKVAQSGIDYSYFLKHGYFNENHKKEKVVGEPTEARITSQGFFVKGFLYKGAGDHWWDLMRSMRESGASRKCGLSVEGKVQRREGNTIAKCWLTAVAITESPVNFNTWVDVVKSLSKEKFCSQPWNTESCTCCEESNCNEGSHEDKCACKVEGEEKKALSAGSMGGRALVPQSLEGKHTNLAYKSLEEVDNLSFEEAIHFLQLSKGYSRKSAEAIADSIFTSHGLR